MRFIMAYSGGKDCTLAMDRMLRTGHELAAIFVSCAGNHLSFKHGIRREIMLQYAKSFGNVDLLESSEATCQDMEDPLAVLRNAAEELEAECICTGDIYQEPIYERNLEVARSAGLELCCPLWGASSGDCVREFLDRGYTAFIKTIKTAYLETELLGKVLDLGMLEHFEEKGIDLCGENGEYHTITTDGPAFQTPLRIVMSNILEGHGYAMIDARSGESL